MNILIINVSLRPNSPVKMFPVGLGYIATSIKLAGFDFDLLDIDAHRPSQVDVERAIRRKKYDAICFGCIVTGYRIVKSLAALIREHQRQAKIIVGNTVASSIPEILLTKTDVDVAVLGEGDETIVDLLQTLADGLPLDQVKGIYYCQDGQVLRNPDRPVFKSLDNLPWIDFSLFDSEIYIENGKEQVSNPIPIPRQEVRMLPINTARGCIGKCTFCYHAFQDKPYRTRSPQSITAEAAHLIDKYQINYLGFSDELTFYNKKQTLRFVETIIDSGLKFFWMADCRAGLFDSEEDLWIIDKMRQAGCHGLAYSLESADPTILKAMNKKITVEQFSKQTQLIRRAGLPVWTSLVFGYPQETPETIARTFDVCIKNGIYPSSGYLLPQPGSVMYDYALEHGFVDDEEEYLMGLGDRQDLYLNMTRMPNEDLVHLVQLGAKRCNEALNVGLADDELIKTLHYRGSASVEQKATQT